GQVMANLMEFMDRETVLAVNAAFQTNFEEAEATLLVDLDEPLVVVAEAIFRAHGARRFSRAANEAEAERFYTVRSHAYLAVKELVSGVQIEDVTIAIDGIAADERDQATLRPEEYPQSGEVRRGRVNQVLGRPFETDQIKRVPNRTPQPVLQLKGAHAALRRDEVASARAELFE